MDLFEQMPVVSNDPLSLFGHMKSGANVGLTSKTPKAHVLVAHNDSCTGSQHALLDRRTRLTFLTRRRCDDREFALRTL